MSRANLARRAEITPVQFLSPGGTRPVDRLWTRVCWASSREARKGVEVADSFTHLHVHTEFSMLDGAARVDDVVAKAAADGQPAIGITDHGNMYGILDFYQACKRHEVNCVIGSELYMAYDHRSERPSRRGKVDDSGGDAEGGRKAYYHLIALA